MKEEILNVRVTSEEKQRILVESKLLNLSVSQYVRNKLNSNHLDNNISISRNIVNTPENICNLLTEIQKLKQVHPEIDFYEVERRAAKLCQC